TSRCVRGIDERGLHVTNLAALSDCLRRVAVPECICLVDGFRVPDVGHEQRAVIDGDARSAAIAAASVIAKVTRDRYMKRAAEELPGWHFHTNVGYSTPEHRAAIGEPASGELPHLGPFRGADRLEQERGADAAAASSDERLDLAENERPVLAHDQIDLAGARAVVPFDHLEAEALEAARGQLL